MLHRACQASPWFADQSHRFPLAGTGLWCVQEQSQLPAVKGLLTDAKLAADLFGWRSGLGLFEREGNLLVCKFRLLHRRFLLASADTI